MGLQGDPEGKLSLNEALEKGFFLFIVVAVVIEQEVADVLTVNRAVGTVVCTEE